MKQARDYRKYNVRLTSADWQRGSGRVINIHNTYVAVPLSPLNKREIMKTPYIQIWCRCGYISAPR